jgi:hypothetical protein
LFLSSFSLAILLASALALTVAVRASLLALSIAALFCAAVGGCVIGLTGVCLAFHSSYNLVAQETVFCSGDKFDFIQLT